MTNRRNFIKTTTILSAGLMLSRSGCNDKKRTIGLQLYTVRDAMAKDPMGTLARVAAIGYNSVETATYTGTQKFYGMTPAEFKAALNKAGLIAPSGHYLLGEAKMNGQEAAGTILHGWQKAVDDAAAAGLQYMVCAFLFDNERGDLDHYKMVADEMNKAGEVCKKAGIQFCYHNHDFEFQKQGDTYPYDILLNTDKDLVKMEIDPLLVNKSRTRSGCLDTGTPGPLSTVACERHGQHTPKRFYRSW